MRLLPIGTIVTLKNATKKILIIGYYAEEQGGREIYDYSGVPYPEGLVDSRRILLFNHSQLGVINHLSINDRETQEFLKQIENLKEDKNGSI